MLWDDHDMSDDWNISRSWLQEMQQRSWWHRRVVGCIASYWIYQHLGNLSPRELAESDLYARVRGNQHADEELFEWARQIDSTGPGTRWSFCRDFGRTRAIFIDSRAGRVLEEDRRAIVDDEEWDWIAARTEGDFDHLLIATTVPWLLSPGFDQLEAWNERLCDGAFGRPRPGSARSCGARSTSTTGPPSWSSFEQLRDLLAEVAAATTVPHRPRSSSSPATSTTPTSATSPFPAGRPQSRLPGRLLALPQPARRPRAGGRPRRFGSPFALAPAGPPRRRPDPGIRWRTLDGPHFDNQVATLESTGAEPRSASTRPFPARARRTALRGELHATAELTLLHGRH